MFCRISLIESRIIMKKSIIVCVLFTGMLLSGCGGESDTSNQDEKSSNAIDTSLIKEGMGDEMYDRARTMFYSMPSPIELQTMIEKAGGYFRADLLHNPQTSSQYQTTDQQALALGVYGTDMSYATVFNQQQESLLFLAAAQRVSKKMGIHDPFNGALIERANANMADKDSMLLIVSELYWELNSQLQEENRNQLGLIVLAAGWLEGIYLGTQIMNAEKPEPEIAKVLMDQRFVAMQLNEMFIDYHDDAFIKATEPFFRPLIDTYLSLKMDEKETTLKESGGKTIIGGASAVIYGPEDLTQIKKLAQEARAKIIMI